MKASYLKLIFQIANNLILDGYLKSFLKLSTFFRPYTPYASRSEESAWWTKRRNVILSLLSCIFLPNCRDCRNCLVPCVRTECQLFLLTRDTSLVHSSLSHRFLVMDIHTEYLASRLIADFHSDFLSLASIIPDFPRLSSFSFNYQFITTVLFID